MYLDISKVTLPTDAVTLNTQRYLKEFQHLDSAFLCFLSMFSSVSPLHPSPSSACEKHQTLSNKQMSFLKQTIFFLCKPSSKQSAIEELKNQGRHQRIVKGFFFRKLSQSYLQIYTSNHPSTAQLNI